MLVSTTTFAYAEDGESGEVNFDEHTREEILIFNDPDGAEIRFLQLEKAVTCNIYNGHLIITNLSGSGYDTIELDTILAEMNLLLDEIKAVDINSSEAVNLYVELKQDAIDLTKEFKDLLHELLNDTTLASLQENVQNIVCQQANGLQSSIRNKISLFNGKQLKEIFRVLGRSDSPILQQYQNGNMTLQQVKQQLALMAHGLNENEKFDVIVEMKPNRIRLQIQSIINIENISNQYGYRKCNRLQNRLNNSENIDNETLRLCLQQRLRLRINETGNGHYGNGNGGDGHQGTGDGGNGSGGGQGSGSGNGSGNGSGQGNCNNNETCNGNETGNHNGPGGGGP